MNVIEWNESLAIGVPEIDGDHEILVDHTNQLFVACFAGQGPAVLADLLRRLADYTQSHHRREEAIMAARKYPGLPAHRADHLRLEDWLERARGRLTARIDHDLSMETLIFLRNWVQSHLRGHDKSFGRFLESVE